MSQIQLIGLKSLMDKMIQNKLSRAAFLVDFNAKSFSCLFITDIIPYRFYLTTLGENPYVIEFEVKKGFFIDDQLDYTDYQALVNYLKYKYDSKNKFRPLNFLHELNEKLPFVLIHTPHYTEVIRVVSKKREVEEANKIYFVGWLPLADGRSVSPRNKEKTLAAFGSKIAELSVSTHTSSKWTDIPELAVNFHTELKK